eukprot:3600962-Rhodomonas_salina.1
MFTAICCSTLASRRALSRPVPPCGLNPPLDAAPCCAPTVALPPRMLFIDDRGLRNTLACRQNGH